jgi:hypothetical protein
MARTEFRAGTLTTPPAIDQSGKGPMSVHPNPFGDEAAVTFLLLLRVRVVVDSSRIGNLGIARMSCGIRNDGGVTRHSATGRSARPYRPGHAKIKRVVRIGEQLYKGRSVAYPNCEQNSRLTTNHARRVRRLIHILVRSAGTLSERAKLSRNGDSHQCVPRC